MPALSPRRPPMPRRKKTVAAPEPAPKPVPADRPSRGKASARVVTPPFAPACCAPDAFDLMAAQAIADDEGRRPLDSDDGLLAAANAVALHLRPGLDTADCARSLVALADSTAEPFGGIAEARARAAENPQAVAAHLHRALFDVAGFRGNATDYYHVDNSCLPAVLESRRGLPITLALVYKLVASRVGLNAWGVGLPGHFVAGVEMGGREIVDCYDGGRILDQRDAADRVAACAGPEAGFDEDMLRPVTHRHWITRLIQNLLQTFTADGRHADVAAMLELEILLWPDQPHLCRDLGLVLARLGQPRSASGWLKTYLDRQPEDPQRSDLEELVAALD